MTKIFTRFQRTLLSILAAMAVLFAVLTAVSRALPKVYFEESLLSISRDGERRIYTGSIYGDDVTITAWQEGGSRFVTFAREGKAVDACRLDYTGGTIATDYCGSLPQINIWKNDELLFAGAYNNTDFNSSLSLFDEDGKPLWGVDIVVQSNPIANRFSFDEYDIARFAHEPSLSYRGSWAFYALVLLLSLGVAAAAAFPEELFYLRHCLSVENPEPTDFYLATQRISCVILTGMLLIGYIMAFWTIVP